MSTKKFMEIFSGTMHAYGIYKLDNEATKGIKHKGKGQTVRSELTEELFEGHLNGDHHLGVIPIDRDNRCRWGCIDVDVYDDLDLEMTAGIIGQQKFPLVLCRSKSGGAHLFLLTKEPIPAKLMQSKLTTYASRLGYGGSEIFPKQTTVRHDDNDLGSWLNLPYQDAANTVRYIIKPDGTHIMDIDEAVKYFKKMQQPNSLFEDDEKKPKGKYDDAPPCIQIMLEQGVSEGGRNIALHAIGVYFKKKFPHDWKDELENVNRLKFEPPLPSAEVVAIQGSVDKKDYKYACSEEQLAMYCDRQKCRRQKYGINSDSPHINIHSASKYNSEPPLFFLSIESPTGIDERVTLTAQQLHSQSLCQVACIEQAGVMQESLRKGDWERQVNELLSNLQNSEEEADHAHMGVKGRFNDILDSYLLGRGVSDNLADALQGKPVREGDNFVFVLTNFEDYVKSKGFTDWKRNRIALQLQTKGATNRVRTVSGARKRLWELPKSALEASNQTEPTPLPPIKKGDF